MSDRNTDLQLISRPERLFHKTHGRSESLPLLNYRPSTDDKENMGKRGHAVNNPGVSPTIKATQEDPLVAENDVRPPMAPLIMFPTTERPEEYKLQHYTHPVRAGDLQLLQKNLPTGGCLITVHEPSDAASWIECNYNHPLLHQLHERGISGPFPMMLSPYTQCLAVFGAFDDPRIMQCAEGLAKLSKFAVILRPRADDPVPRFSLSKFTDQPIDSDKKMKVKILTMVIKVVQMGRETVTEKNSPRREMEATATKIRGMENRR
ncbi:hypothetical protein B0H11DRAFT_804812 [Mycena galericulata]|nr:hypothetical protein B0H11DRAFT_804812 [Mycena galericulata]